MFERLRSDIDALDIPLDGRALSEALVLLDRLAAKVTRAAGEFDRARLWDLEGATSMRAWLGDAGWSSRQASAMTTTAKRVRALPVLASAWERGELSGGQVEAVVRGVPDRHVELLADHEADVVPLLVGLPVADTARAMSQWSANADAVAGTPQPDPSARSICPRRSTAGLPTAPSTPRAARCCRERSSWPTATTSTSPSPTAEPKPS
jgi:hypothetical protein